MFICSLASINLTSTSSLKIWAIKYLALQQVVIFAHFIPASHNDLLISESSDRAILVYLEFGTILITTTSCWYFPCPYRYLPFLFQDYQQMGGHVVSKWKENEFEGVTVTNLGFVEEISDVS